MRLPVALLIAALLTIFAPLKAQPTAITDADIDAAIRWGTNPTGNAAPYLLHHAQQPGTTSALVVGVVYTPFVRAALAAKMARDAAHTFSREDVRSEWTEPVVYVAFRWYCCLDAVHGSTPETWNPFADPFDYRIALPGETVGPTTGVSTTPLWVRRDVSALLNPFGGARYPDVVLVAAYPLSAFSAPTDFVIYRPVHWIPHRPNSQWQQDFEVGRLTQSDVAAWR